MSAQPPPDDAGKSPPKDPAPGSTRSDLEEGMAQLGRAFGGVMTNLLGEKVTGLHRNDDRPILSEEADAAVDRAGQTVGQWLRGAGEALKQNPLDPGKAYEKASELIHEPVPEVEGVKPLAIGLRSLAGGLFKTTEAILDQVAPRSPKAEAEKEEEPPEGEGGA